MTDYLETAAEKLAMTIGGECSQEDFLEWVDQMMYEQYHAGRQDGEESERALNEVDPVVAVQEAMQEPACNGDSPLDQQDNIQVSLDDG